MAFDDLVPVLLRGAAFLALLTFLTGVFALLIAAMEGSWVAWATAGVVLSLVAGVATDSRRSA